MQKARATRNNQKKMVQKYYVLAPWPRKSVLKNAKFLTGETSGVPGYPPGGVVRDYPRVSGESFGLGDLKMIIKTLSQNMWFTTFRNTRNWDRPAY